MLATSGSSPAFDGSLRNSIGRTKCVDSGSDFFTTSLDSWNSRSRRSVCVDTRHTTGRPWSISVPWLCGMALVSDPELLWLRVRPGRLASGEFDEKGVGDVRALREDGRSVEGVFS